MTNYRKPAHGTEKLKLFFNGFEYVIAESPAAAAALIAIHFGERTLEASRGDDLKLWEELECWELLDLLMWEGIIVGRNTFGATSVDRSVQAWIEFFGVGYLASTDE